MNRAGKALGVVALMALAACSQNGILGDGSSGSGSGSDLAGAGAGAAGSIDDPTSLVYFQQAVGDRVFFLVDQKDLNDTARNVLNAQATWLTQNADYTAVIEGHADEQGTREYNVALGAERANEVRDYLISRGVAGNRIKTVSYGKERPIEICSDESCYSQNRRAVTVLTAGLTG